MRRIVLLAVLPLALVCSASTAQAGTPVAGFTDTQFVGTLGQVTAIDWLPDGRMVLVEKTGALKLVENGVATTLTTVPVCTASEMGLLGIAVDPNFTTNGFVYMYRTKPAAGGCGSSTGRFNQVVRVTMAGSTVVPGSLTELLTGIRTDLGNHDGGTLRIGPADSKLYVSVGDTGLGDSGGPGQSTNPYAQDLGSLEGKVLRLELITGAPAAGNPFTGVAGARPEIYALGLRNPFRMGFDDSTGRLWLGDVGQSAFEELDIIQAGGNYSWPHCEGTEPPGCLGAGTVDPEVPPIFTYPLSGPGSLGRTIIAGDFAPAGFGSFAGGEYYFADNNVSKLYRATVNAARDDIVGTPTDFVTGASGPVDVRFGPDGALYYASINTGEVRRVAPGPAHPRPGGATPLRVPLVPAYSQCTSPNATHTAPLSFPSCAPPAQQSSLLTTSTTGKQSAMARFQVLVGDPLTPADEADIEIRSEASDVKRRSDGTDYAGTVLLRTVIRITDRANSGTSPGSTQDFTFSVPVTCVVTADLTRGSDCDVVTTADTLVAGVAQEGDRAVISTGTVQLLDAGPDGSVAPSSDPLGLGCPPTCGSGDEQAFLRQGVFTP